MSYWSYRSYRGVQDCQCGEPQIAEEHRGSRRVTEEHRDGRRASARRTLQGSLEVWRLGSLDRPDVARLSRRTRRTKGRVGARQRPLCPGPCALSCLCGKGRSPGRRSRPSNQRISQSANQPGAPMERPCLRGEGSHRSAYGRTQPQVHVISHAVLQGVVLFYGRKHECELLIFVSPIPPYRGPEAIRPGPFSGSRKKIKESACIL